MDVTSSPLFKVLTGGVEGYVFELLSKHLSRYVHLSREQLNVSGWAGEGVLEGVSVRPEAFRGLPLLPSGVRVRSGHAARIRVRIPWHALRSQPMLIIVENLCLFCIPDVATHDPSEKQDTSKAGGASSSSSTAVSAAAAAGKAASAASSSSSSSSSSGYFDRIASVLLHNIELHVKHLRVRLDHHEAGRPDKSFEACLGAEAVSVRAADLEWRPSFVWPDGDKIRRRVELRGMTVSFRRPTTGQEPPPPSSATPAKQQAQAQAQPQPQQQAQRSSGGSKAPVPKPAAKGEEADSSGSGKAEGQASARWFTEGAAAAAAATAAAAESELAARVAAAAAVASAAATSVAEVASAAAAAAAAASVAKDDASRKSSSNEDLVVLKCDTTLLIAGAMAAPPHTTRSKWRVWLWLPLLRTRLDESQMRDLYEALYSKSGSGGGKGGKPRFDKRVWSADDDAGWWACSMRLLSKMPGAANAGSALKPSSSSSSKQQQQAKVVAAVGGGGGGQQVAGAASNGATMTEATTAAAGNAAAAATATIPAPSSLAAAATPGATTPSSRMPEAMADAAAAAIFGADGLHDEGLESPAVPAEAAAAAAAAQDELKQEFADWFKDMDASSSQDGLGGGDGGGSGSSGLASVANGAAPSTPPPASAASKPAAGTAATHAAAEPASGGARAAAAGGSAASPTPHADGLISGEAVCYQGQGICLHLTVELKRNAGELPTTLTSQAARLTQLTRTLREAPDEAANYYSRACTLLTMRMFSEAAHDADACLRLQPKHAKARFAKGRALYFLGEYESAFAQYDTGLRLDRNPKIEAWLTAERRKPEYNVTPGPVALLGRLDEAVRAGDIKRLALVLCRCPADALDGGLVSDGGRRSAAVPPLHLAAGSGQVDCCVLLLQRSASLDSCDAAGRTPIMLALEGSHVECACALLPHCKHPDVACHQQRTALHRAAAGGMSAAVALLTSRGAHVGATDARGRNALHEACLAGEPVVLMQMASASKANANATAAAAAEGDDAASTPKEVVLPLDAQDHDGCSPMLLAARAAYQGTRRRPQQLHCVQMCLALGADACQTASNPPQSSRPTSPPAAMAAAAAASPALTPPSATAATPAAATAAVTTTSNTPPDVTTTTTMTAAALGALSATAPPASPPLPLHYYLAAVGAADVLLQVLEKLLRKRAAAAKSATSAASSSSSPPPPPPPLDALHPSNGLSVLHFAAAHGECECVKLLLAHGCAPDVPDAAGSLASDHALRGMPGRCLPGEGHAECHALLLRHLAR